MKKEVVSKLRQEVKLRVDIVTSDDIKIYYTGKFQDFTARYIIKLLISLTSEVVLLSTSWGLEKKTMNVLENGG